MKILILLLIPVFLSSFNYSSKKGVKQSYPGFYIYVENFKDRTNNKFIVESKDSLNSIFNSYFNMELELGEVERPISIYNGHLSFYVARVNVFENQKGKKKFKHLQYPRITGRQKLKPAIL